MRTIVCCSGQLGCVGLKAIATMKSLQISAVLTDRASASIQEFSQQKGYQLYIGNSFFQEKTTTFASVDLLISVNYLFILPSHIYSQAKRLAINIHGSLLPKYMGRTPNTWVIIHDESKTGITVHQITENCDSGDILYQEEIPIANKDTAGTLTEKMAKRYPEIIRNIVQQIHAGTYQLTKQDLSKRMYCGKRDAGDGEIDWRWSSRRVYNWVRAQTRPYPGAFFYHQRKIWRVWWVEQCDDLLELKKRRIGVPFEVNKRTYVRCGQGAVRLVDVAKTLG